MRLRLLLPLLAAVVLLAAVGLPLGYEAGWYALTTPDQDRFPLRGLDVSHHQGPIDWARVAADDVDFVWIKATEGGDWTDPRFAENQAGARAVGLPWGAYHFVTLCRPMDEQAAHILATVPSSAALPLALDLEYGGNCSVRPDREAFLGELTRLRNTLREAYGTEPLLYATAEFHRDYLDGYAPEAPRWHRSLLVEPPEDALVWQFRNRGRAAGISGPVDVNVARELPGIVDRTR